MSTISNTERFEAFLSAEYARLFVSDPEYAYVAAKSTPDELAAKMTAALKRGSGSKDGKAIKRACAAFGIKHTYKAISAFLNNEVQS